MNVIGIIPARFASSRFPGKPLVDIGGKSMINRVYEQVLKATGLSQVVVATDDERIYNHVIEFGGKAVMTLENHPSGTDRCYEAALAVGATSEDVIINIQGDEPFIKPEEIDKLAVAFTSPETQLATLIKIITNPEDITNPNKVKVVLNTKNEAIYFSRSPIPYIRGEEDWISKFTFYHHIGIYAYRMKVLSEITKLAPSSLELAESLEQLRWIENAYTIKTVISNYESIAVDTPEDLERIIKDLKF